MSIRQYGVSSEVKLQDELQKGSWMRSMVLMESLFNRVVLLWYLLMVSLLKL